MKRLKVIREFFLLCFKYPFTIKENWEDANMKDDPEIDKLLKKLED